jgi:hypothetical protein
LASSSWLMPTFFLRDLTSLSSGGMKYIMTHQHILYI